MHSKQPNYSTYSEYDFSPITISIACSIRYACILHERMVFIFTNTYPYTFCIHVHGVIGGIHTHRIPFNHLYTATSIEKHTQIILAQQVNEIAYHKVQQKLFQLIWNPDSHLINQKKVYQNRSMGTCQLNIEHILAYISAQRRHSDMMLMAISMCSGSKKPMELIIRM